MDGLNFLIYKNAGKSLDIKDPLSLRLISDDKWKEMSKGDDNPYLKIESIDYPAQGTGGTYQPDFFKSFVNQLKDRPYPGSKRGHEYQSRPSSDFYTIGGKTVDNKDGTGTAYLLMYIPPKGDTTDNSGFIRDAKLGIVHFSLVSKPKMEITQDKNGNTIVNFVASDGYERNDAVEYGTGAMKQTVNAQSVHMLSASLAKATSLINSGKVDKTSAWKFTPDDENKLLGSSGDDWATFKAWHLAEDTSESEETKARYKYPYGKNGKVYRSALRTIASRAAAQGLSDLSDTASNLLQLMDKKKSSKSQGNKSMDEELQVVKNCLDNGVANVNDVASKLGIKTRTDEDVKNANIISGLMKQYNCKADEIGSVLKNIEDTVTKANKAAAENEIIKKFGTATVKNADNKDVENLAYTRAMELCANKSGSELQEALKNAESDKYIVAFKSQLADTTTDINTITVPANQNKDTNVSSLVKNGRIEL